MPVYLDPHDLSRVQAKLRTLSGAVQRRVLARSLSRVATDTRAEAVRRARGELTRLRAKAVRDQIELRRAIAASPASELIIRKAPGILLGEFGARQTRRGVTVTVKRGRRLLRHAFVAPGRFSGKRLVFARERGAGRYPIRALRGPSAFDVLQEHVAPLGDFAREQTRSEALRQIELVIRGQDGF